jgi:hypothetical protein
MVSFVAIPAYDHAFINHRITLRETVNVDGTSPEEIRESQMGPDEFHCLIEYMQWRAITLASHIQVSNAPDKELLLTMGQFFTHASMTSEQAKDHRARLNLYFMLREAKTL